MKEHIKFILVVILILGATLLFVVAVVHVINTLENTIKLERIENNARRRQELRDGIRKPSPIGFGTLKTSALEQELFQQAKLKTRLLEKQLEEQCK